METIKNNFKNYIDVLFDLQDKIWEDIRTIFKKYNKTSLNLYPYCREDMISPYLFFDIDKNGYGVAVEIDTIKLCDNGKFFFTMVTVDGDSWCDFDMSDFNTNQTLNILSMMLDIVKSIESGEKWLEINEDFDEE